MTKVELQRLSPQARVAPAAGVLFREIDGEAIVLHTGTGYYFGLDEVGIEIWNLLLALGRPGAVLERLAEIFDAPRERLERDLERFLGDLLQHELVEIHES